MALQVVTYNPKLCVKQPCEGECLREMNLEGSCSVYVCQ